MYDCELTKAGLPSTGHLNGMVLTNSHEEVSYLNGLDDAQKIVFLDLVKKTAYSEGYRDGEDSSAEPFE